MAKGGKRSQQEAGGQGDAATAKLRASAREAAPEPFRGGPGGIRRREVCKFFLEGRCKEGDACGFLHEGTPKRRVEACKFFLAGRCGKGGDCLYSHDLKSTPCRRMVLDGACRDGAACRFSHAALSAS